MIIDNNDDDEDDNVPTFEEELGSSFRLNGYLTFILENDKPLKNVEVDENAEHGALVKDLIESKKVGLLNSQNITQYLTRQSNQPNQTRRA